MAITVKSPYSGRPVKVREQDIGRAIRDEQGRVFYVVPRSEGDGYYAARTRHGSEKQEQAYLQLEAQPPLEAPVEAGQPAVHDATGRRRPMRPGVILALLVILALIGILWYSWYTGGAWPWQSKPAPPQQVAPPTTAPVSSANRVAPNAYYPAADVGWALAGARTDVPAAQWSLVICRRAYG